LVDQIERVRAFNRYYTQRLGVLSDHYLDGSHALALSEARLLFEIGSPATASPASGSGVDVRELRARLGLDSGYLSRLLRKLTRLGLVTLHPHPSDRRVRIASLTPAGLQERADLDRRARESVAGLLGGLSTAQRERLIDAQELIRRLLRTAAVTISPVPDSDAYARECLRRYADELSVRFPSGYSSSALLMPGELDGTFLLAQEAGEPVGCVAWQRLASAGVAEIRHLWVSASARGLGLGRRLLEAIEQEAASHGMTMIRLGTHSSLPEAIELYRSSGYHEISPYGDSVYNELNFEKPLPSPA
jgi:DNA-binding MarR family transcriptional regulator/GNAT superfamily N-acetyltransferase